MNNFRLKRWLFALPCLTDKTILYSRPTLSLVWCWRFLWRGMRRTSTLLPPKLTSWKCCKSSLVHSPKISETSNFRLLKGKSGNPRMNKIESSTISLMDSILVRLINNKQLTFDNLDKKTHSYWLWVSPLQLVWPNSLHPHGYQSDIIKLLVCDILTICYCALCFVLEGRRWTRGWIFQAGVDSESLPPTPLSLPHSSGFATWRPTARVQGRERRS